MKSLQGGQQDYMVQKIAIVTHVKVVCLCLKLFQDVKYELTGVRYPFLIVVLPHVSYREGRFEDFLCIQGKGSFLIYSVLCLSPLPPPLHTHQVGSNEAWKRSLVSGFCTVQVVQQHGSDCHHFHVAPFDCLFEVHAVEAPEVTLECYL